MFCLNGTSVYGSLWKDVYFSNTIEIDQQKALLSSLLETTKRFSLRLLDLKEFMLEEFIEMSYREKGVPRIEQVILPDLKVNLRIGTFSSSLSARLFSQRVASSGRYCNKGIFVSLTESVLLIGRSATLIALEIDDINSDASAFGFEIDTVRVQLPSKLSL